MLHGHVLTTEVADLMAMIEGVEVMVEAAVADMGEEDREGINYSNLFIFSNLKTYYSRLQSKNLAA